MAGSILIAAALFVVLGRELLRGEAEVGLRGGVGPTVTVAVWPCWYF